MSVKLPMLYLRCKKCNIEFVSWIRTDKQIFRTLDLRGNCHTCPNGHNNRYDQKDYHYEALAETKIGHRRSVHTRAPCLSLDTKTPSEMEKQIEELRQQLDRTVRENALLTKRLANIESDNVAIRSLLERLQKLENRFGKDATAEINGKE
jgi:hypothetical protein